jgi:triacylglycerol esterase/lipase EstA (alpha/beta hydrolase family)
MRSIRRRSVLAVVTIALLGGLLTTTAAAPAGAATPEPRYHVATADLRAALHCAGGFDSAHQPVLLVHGTFTHGVENYGWNYLPELEAQGFDACYVDLPNRSLDDIQLSSEYVVFAIRKIHRLSGRRVDVMGHSQGGLQPRWALRWWPSLRPMVSDLVTLATPSHGTALGNFGGGTCAACFQMAQGSDFIGALNSVDETPGAVEYTNIYTTLQDELVVPATSAETAGATNINIQSVCPARPVDHVTIAADRAVLAMVLDAFTHRGPTSLGRLPADLCTALPPLFPSDPTAAIAVLQADLADAHVPSGSMVSEEPPLRRYTSR